MVKKSNLTAQNSSSPRRANWGRGHDTLIPLGGGEYCQIRVKGRHELEAVARYLMSKENEPSHIQEILDGATLKNGKSLRERSKGAMSLGNRLSAHPHFLNANKEKRRLEKGDKYSQQAYWYLGDTNTYLLKKRDRHGRGKV